MPEHRQQRGRSGTGKIIEFDQQPLCDLPNGSLRQVELKAARDERVAMLAVNDVQAIQIGPRKLRQYIGPRRCRRRNCPAVHRGAFKLHSREQPNVEIEFFGVPDGVAETPEVALRCHGIVRPRPGQQ
ncbi:hypothetical protein, partial [Mesorhizobium sp. M1A.F.Ca.IN.020.32.1.1]|uniref:hypothetical protein n=1 Tax=Mesorhizobium sp. M1A.F.Ca.IN.020.32.1.1 TaxID=2496763 RepID=UPI0019D42ACC